MGLLVLGPWSGTWWAPPRWLSVCSVLLTSIDFRRWAGGLVVFIFFLPRESVDFLTLVFSESLRGDSTSSGNT